MPSDWEKFDNAFRHTSAIAVFDEAQFVASINFKFRTAVTAFVHFHTTAVQIGRACGGGYDRKSAAVDAAATKLRQLAIRGDEDARPAPDMRATFNRFLSACVDNDGHQFDQRLRDAGFTVAQVH